MKLKDYPTHESNPSKPEGITLRKGYTKSHSVPVQSLEDGTVYDLQVNTAKGAFLKDEGAFVKLFDTSIQLMSDLSSAGLKLMLYVISQLQLDTDKVYLYPADAVEKMGYSGPPMYYRGLLELLEKRILYRVQGRENEFYINTNVLFRGDRTKVTVLEINDNIEPC